MDGGACVILPIIAVLKVSQCTSRAINRNSFFGASLLFPSIAVAAPMDKLFDERRTIMCQIDGNSDDDFLVEIQKARLKTVEATLMQMARVPQPPHMTHQLDLLANSLLAHAHEEEDDEQEDNF